MEECYESLCDGKMPIKLKEKFYRTVIRPAMLYGSECWAIKRQHISKICGRNVKMNEWSYENGSHKE